uniref:Cullin-4B n=1 Tax=Coccidioides posadasii RMSCC 3488 TaxID=454284 RepID=A0A0J6FFJ2_COCPO|nr:cullin-4B [Coccidioides posadasii RMSCC 3488]
MQNHGTRGTRKPGGKRKLCDGNSETAEDLVRNSQGTIPDLFSRGRNTIFGHKSRQLSPTSKRLKRNELDPQQQSPSKQSQPAQERIPVERMYSFPNQSAKSSSLGQQNSRTVPRTYLNPSSTPSNFTPHTGPKRLTVKNLRVVPKLDQEQYFEKIWAQLNTALTAIFNEQKPSFSLEELYKGAENVCRQKRAQSLAKKLQERCKVYISESVLPSLLAKSKDSDDIVVLRAVEAAWSAWSSRLVTIRSIFYYLDQSFLLRSPEHPTIYEMGTIGFRSIVFSNPSLKPKMLQGACQLVDLDRNNDASSDSTLLRNAIKLFSDLRVYKSEFEPAMLEASDRYLKAWADNEANSSYLATYVSKSHRVIEKEMERCDLFNLDIDTKQRLSEMLDKRLVSDQSDTLLKESDVLGLLRTSNQIALGELYSLLQRIDLGSKLKPAFTSFILEEGSSIVFDKEREGEMVVRLLDFKQNLDDILAKSFQKDELLARALRESFETFINKSQKGGDVAQPGEMIAKHVDLLLRGGLKSIRKRQVPLKNDEDIAMIDEDAELNKALDQVLDLFRFVHGKAVFEAFYKNDLARRLLMGRSASDDAEKSMLARLASECGSNFTHNLESMFKDIDLARDEMASYNALLREKREKTNLDLYVNVLSSAAWPSYPDVPVKVPRIISSALSDFEHFYNNKYNGRKLNWKHSLAHCQLKARFPSGNKEIVVSSFQAIVLLLFNDVADGQTLSYHDIRDETGLSDIELKRTLQSLACAKYRVLIKHPKGRDINATDTFSFNTRFSDPKMRIKINQIQLKETKEENKETHERVAADRNYETQAAIVRIMKSRKTISPQELIVEVIKATRNRGDLDPADIKKNIDKLIEKEYMERDTESNKYKYIA